MSNLAEILGKQIDRDIIRKVIQKNAIELKTQFKAESSEFSDHTLAGSRVARAM